MKGIAIILILVLCYFVSYTQFVVSGDASIVVTANATLNINSEVSNAGTVTNQGVINSVADWNNQSILQNTNNALFSLGGNMSNTGIINNVGEIRLGGDWINENSYNGIDGILELNGFDNQIMVNGSNQLLGTFIVNNGMTNTLFGDSIRIVGTLSFENGFLQTSDTTRLIIEEDAEVTGGNENAYFEGKLFQKGNGFRFFPLGFNGLYLPLTLENVSGINPILSVELGEFDEPPIPSNELVGVSEFNYWFVDVVSGTFTESLIEVEFERADLSNFTNTNNLNLVSGPVLVEADSVTGPYNSLGKGSLLDSDEETFGIIESDLEFTRRYIAIGLGPERPRGGILYVPNAFSPNASNLDDQVFKVFGEDISNENFSIIIFNRFGVEVFQSNDFDFMNTIGWDGTNQSNSNESTAGIYRYILKGQFINGNPFEKNGVIHLIK